MLAHELIFMPGEDDKEEIKEGKPYQKDGIAEREAVELVCDKETKNANTCGICPHLVAEQTNDEKCLYNAMRKEIGGPECLYVAIEVGNPVLYLIRNEIIGILEQFCLGEVGEEVGYFSRE